MLQPSPSCPGVNDLIARIRQDVDAGGMIVAEAHSFVRLEAERRRATMAMLAVLKPKARGYRDEAEKYEQVLEVLDQTPEALAEKINKCLANERREAGRLLKALKERKPAGLTWEHYLEDLCIPLGKRQADKLIEDFDEAATESAPQQAQTVAQRAIDIAGKSKRSSKGRWRASANECDYDHEKERAFPDDPDWKYNGDAADWQQAEGKRLAQEYALFRKGTRANDFTKARESALRAIAREWLRAVDKIQSYRRAKMGT